MPPTLDNLILFADLVGSTDVACELPIDVYSKTYIGSFYWAASKAFRLIIEAGTGFDGEIDGGFVLQIKRDEWNIVGDQLTAITFLNGRKENELNSLVSSACAFAYNLKLFWLMSPYNLFRLQNRQFPRDLAVGLHIGPLSTVSKAIPVSAGLHLSVTKRIETEARTGIESRIFASPDIVHGFNAWATPLRQKEGNFQKLPPLSSTIFRRREKSIEAKGIPKPLRVSELEWSDKVLDDFRSWEHIMDTADNIPNTVWDDTADSIAKTLFDPMSEYCKSLGCDDVIFDQVEDAKRDESAGHLIKCLVQNPVSYIQQWFAAIASQPKIFADEAWLVLNTLFISVSLYRYIKIPDNAAAAGVSAKQISDFRDITKRVLKDWEVLRKSAKEQENQCPYLKNGK
ncbi:MAG: hypothetical protein PF904_00300 [Kiritimatiellae bacterium]|jgi:hypothetical protein|nr:hypothetical protein [Kiritimatiellia bacterium]